MAAYTTLGIVEILRLIILPSMGKCRANEGEKGSTRADSLLSVA
jgi:hypothetical protein